MVNVILLPMVNVILLPIIITTITYYYIMLLPMVIIYNYT